MKRILIIGAFISACALNAAETLQTAGFEVAVIQDSGFSSESYNFDIVAPVNDDFDTESNQIFMLRSEFIINLDAELPVFGENVFYDGFSVGFCGLIKNRGSPNRRNI